MEEIRAASGHSVRNHVGRGAFGSQPPPPPPPLQQQKQQQQQQQQFPAPAPPPMAQQPQQQVPQHKSSRRIDHGCDDPVESIAYLIFRPFRLQNIAQRWPFDVTPIFMSQSIPPQIIVSNDQSREKAEGFW